MSFTPSIATPNQLGIDRDVVEVDELHPELGRQAAEQVLAGDQSLVEQDIAEDAPRLSAGGESGIDLGDVGDLCD